MKADNSIIYSIRWDNLAYDTYLYGSTVLFKPDGTVKFSNQLMPPGQIIRKWQSDVKDAIASDLSESDFNKATNDENYTVNINEPVINWATDKINKLIASRNVTSA